MKKSLIAIALTLAAAGAFAEGPVRGAPSADVMAALKQAAADLLKDPDAAKFRNDRYWLDGDASTMCVEMNGKNSYGGYVGYQMVIVRAWRTQTAPAVIWPGTRANFEKRCAQ